MSLPLWSPVLVEGLNCVPCSGIKKQHAAIKRVHSFYTLLYRYFAILYVCRQKKRVNTSNGPLSINLKSGNCVILFLFCCCISYKHMITSDIFCSLTIQQIAIIIFKLSCYQSVSITRTNSCQVRDHHYIIIA